MGDFMEKIENFIGKRPDVVAAYGYGSGVFKQEGYTSNDKAQIDLIFIVENIKEWHLENISKNPNDYSLLAKYFFKTAKTEKLKGKTGVTYQSNINEDDSLFKYGVIEKKDLINNINSWNSFYMPGRFQKTIKTIKDDDNIREYIEKNRYNAMLVAALLQKENIVSKKDLIETIVSLSYMGDTRMAFAENPKKIQNIVNGSYDLYDEMYSFDSVYLKFDEYNNVIINKDLIRWNLEKLPAGLYEYIKDYKYSKTEELVKRIIEYFTITNKDESISQTLKGIETNGITRSISYASKKVLKRFKK